MVHIQITKSAIDDLIECVRELKAENSNTVVDEDHAVDLDQNDKFKQGDYSGESSIHISIVSAAKGFCNSGMTGYRKLKRLGTGTTYGRK